MAPKVEFVKNQAYLIHPEGQIPLLAINRRIFASGGEDGEIAFHKFVQKNLGETLCRKRVHREAINCLTPAGPFKGNLQGYKIISGGKDGCIYSTIIIENGKMQTKQVFTNESSVMRLDIHGEVVIFGLENGDLGILNLNDQKNSHKIISKINMVVGIAFIDKFNFITVENDGKINIWSNNSLGNDDEFKPIRSISLNVHLSMGTKVELFDRKMLFINCPENGTFAINCKDLMMVEHIWTQGKGPFSMSILSQANLVASISADHLTLLNASTGLISFDLELKEFKFEFPLVNICGFIPNCFFAVDASGIVFSILCKDLNCELTNSENWSDVEPLNSASASAPAQSVSKPLKKKNSSFILDSDMEEEEEEAVAVKKRSRNLPDNNESELNLSENDLLNDYNVTESENEYGDNEDDDHGKGSQSDNMEIDHQGINNQFINGKGKNNLFIPECIHKTFQPSSTPWTTDHYRFLCWNNVGLITDRKDEIGNYKSIEIEFHDKLFHRPIRFIDEVGYTMASVGKSGAIFASPSLGNDVPSVLHFVPLDNSWTSTSPWSIELSLKEEIIGVAVGGKKYSVFVTNQGYIRTISSSGLQGPVVNYPRKFISMTANDDLLFFVHADEFGGELGFILFDLDSLKIIKTGPIGGRFKNLRILWIGLSSNNLMGIFDESQKLHICNPDLDYQWQVFDCGDNLDMERKNLWPVHFNSMEITCIVVDDNIHYPEPVPRPVLSLLPLRVPLLPTADSTVNLYEPVFRTCQLFTSVSLYPELSERETRKLQLSSDKHILELVQIAIKMDKPIRVLEYCEMFLMDKSWDLAIQLIRHNKMVQLADRVEKLRDIRSSPSSTTQTKPNDDISKVRTPRKRVTDPSLDKQVESPATILSTLTPTACIKSIGNVIDTESKAAVSNNQNIDLNNFTSPFAKLSFDSNIENNRNNSNNNDKLDFETMMKSVNGALINHENDISGKRAKINSSDKSSVSNMSNKSSTQIKPQKQTNLSIFSSNTDQGHAEG